jgi:hypothetical protein
MEREEDSITMILMLHPVKTNYIEQFCSENDY